MRSSTVTTMIRTTSVLCICWAQDGMAGVGNLLENGSFEHGAFQIEVVPTLPATGYWGHVPTNSAVLQGWAVSLSPDDPDGRATTPGLEWVATIPMSSSHPDGVMVVDLVHGVDFFRIATEAFTTAGRRYRVTLWAQGGGVVGLRIEGNSVRLAQSIPVVEDLSWRQITFSFTADSGVTQLELWASQAGTVIPDSGPMLDAVSLVPIEDLALQIDLYAGINFTGTPGRTYRVEYATVVEPTAWQVLTNFVLPTTPYLFIDQTSAASSGERFYRAVELP